MEKKEGATRERRKILFPPLFQKSIDGIRKDYEKNKFSDEKFKTKLCSQYSDCSKEISSEHTLIDKNNSIPLQGKALPPNDKPYEGHTKQNFHSRQSVDHHQDISGTQDSRRFRYHNSNNSSQYNINTRHDHFEKSYKSTEQKSSNSYQEKFSPSNDKTSKDLVKPVLNSRQFFGQNNVQMQLHMYHNKSNASNRYHLNSGYNYPKNAPKINYVNSDSFVDSSDAKTVKHFSKFKYSDSELPYNSKKYNKSSQHDSYRENFNRKNPNSDQSFKTQSTNIQNDIEENIFADGFYSEDSFTSENFNPEVIVVDTNIKHQRTFTELNKTDKNCKEIIRVTCNFTDSGLKSDSFVSSSSNEPVSEILNEPKLSISSVSSISNVSTATSPTSISFDYPSLTNDALEILNSPNDSIIPPPVACDSTNVSENIFPSSVKSSSIQNNGFEPLEDDPSVDEADFSLPDSEHLEAISDFIAEIVKNRSAPGSVADRVTSDLNRLFKNNFEGNNIDYYGSYFCGLAITTSDINLMIQTNASMRKSFMNEIYKVLSKELERYHVYSYEEGETIYKSKINFTHPDTGINCELAYLGKRKENIVKMGKFFKEICRRDQRVKHLIIAAKVWAEHFHINEVEDGKLHPVGFALLVVHYLQHCENPVLPIYSTEEENIECPPKNDATIGTLWLGFLWYYAFIFNWKEDVLTVTSKDRVSKKSKQWENYWIAIEDPFTEKNIALSVINKDVADYIKCCFKNTYDYFLNGPENIPSFDEEENESSNESNNSQLKFSFNDCVVEQNEDFCEECDDNGDLCEECKKKISVQPDLVCIPKMTDEFLKIVKKALEAIYDKYMLSQIEVSERKQFVKKLESDVRRIYPDAQMRLFGSSANGFGFKKSDIDICLTFKSKGQFKSFSVLKDLRNLLRRDKNFVNVIAIFNAQIPILKFRYEPKGWHGDISLENVLAVYNSELLYTYSLIDERCKILGCALKLLAKKALIAEVTEKALSSYSYLIMVIHFLQQTDPPILPILQDNQFREGTFELEDIFDNCNVWFCRDVKYIEKVFKAENNTPVEELFLDLLDYYCSIDCNQVITIRQKEKLTHCEKMRLARLFQIQDPFLETKNLGCVVSPTKAYEIKNIFKRARMLFRTPKKEIPNDDLENYFFSTMSLTGRYQKEVLCDFCGKFGHDQNECKHSTLQKKFIFNHGPRKYKYPNRNNFFKKSLMNRYPFKKKV